MVPQSEFYVDGDEPWAGYSCHQWKSFFDLMAASIEESGGRLINSPRKSRCLVKPFQQMFAAQCGFRVPRTIISNKKTGLVSFVGESPSVLKELAVKPYFVVEDGACRQIRVQTTAVDCQSILDADDEKIGICPNFIQQEIVKKYEVRAVVAGRKMVCFKISSQDHDLTKLDWRKYPALIGIEVFDVPDDVSSRILRFMDKIGLDCGSLDLIVDEGGNYWFLECNKEGQWGMFDQLSKGRCRICL